MTWLVLCLTTLTWAVAAWAGPPDTLWVRHYGGLGDHSGYSLLATVDGNYVVAGKVDSASAGEDGWLLKVSPDGDSLWSRRFGGHNPDAFFAVQQTADSGFLLGGRTQSWGHGNHDMWLLKTNAAGDSLWSRTFGAGNPDRCYGMTLRPDGRALLCGVLYVNGNYFTLIETAANGDSLRARSYNQAAIDWGQVVIPTHDGGFMLAGESGGSTFRAVLLDSALMLRRSLGDNGQGLAYAALQLPDSSFIIAGEEGPVPMVLRVGINGTVQWRRAYPGSGQGEYRACARARDGGVLLAGGLYGRTVLVKFDLNGQMEWSEYYPGTAAWGLLETPDGGWLMAGYGEVSGRGRDLFLIKLGPERLPAVEVRPELLIFPEVIVGQWVSLPVVIRNSGNDDLILDSVRSTQPEIFLHDMPRADTLEPDRELTVNVLFRPTGAGRFIAQLEVTTNLADSITVIPMSGVGLANAAETAGAPSLDWRLSDPTPNPFNALTRISFDLPRSAQVRLAIYDLTGREVAVGADGVFTAGSHTILLDGRALPSGLYFCRLRTAEFSATKKMLLLK